MYLFSCLLAALMLILTIIRIYKDRRKKINKRESVLEYFHPLHEATGPGATFSVLLVIIVWWTIAKIIYKAWIIVMEWIN